VKSRSRKASWACAAGIVLVPLGVSFWIRRFHHYTWIEALQDLRAAAQVKDTLLYMANCHLSSDWQFKQSVAVALPAVILKAGGLRGWAARFLPGRVAG